MRRRRPCAATSLLHPSCRFQGERQRPREGAVLSIERSGSSLKTATHALFQGGTVADFLLAAVGVLIACFLAFEYSRSIAAGRDLPEEPTGVVLAWISSAECARTTGFVVASCDGGKPAPYSNLSPADDPGHAFATRAYSRFTDKPLNPDYGSAANTSTNYAGVVVLAALLLSMRLWAPAALLALAGPIIEGSFHAYSPHPAQRGATCLAMILPLALFAMTGRSAKILGHCRVAVAACRDDAATGHWRDGRRRKPCCAHLQRIPAQIHSTGGRCCPGGCHRSGGALACDNNPCPR